MITQVNFNQGNQPQSNQTPADQTPADQDQTRVAGLTQVLLLGSYNGQDSLGDACLLRSVINQFETKLPNAQFVVHLNQHTPFMEEMTHAHPVVGNAGIQSLAWLSQYYARKTRLPAIIANNIARLLFPLFFLLCSLIPSTRCHLALRQILQTDVVVVFGGTNFSRQWFWRNIPYYFMTTLIARLSGAKCYFSAQQYGPMTTLQTRLVDWWTAWLIDDYRLRNEACLKVFSRHQNTVQSLNSRQLVWDEVYSNAALYPVTVAQPFSQRNKITPFTILMNVRGENFVDSSVYGDEQIQWYQGFIREFSRMIIQQASGADTSDGTGRIVDCVKWNLFAVSGPGMAEDENILRSLVDRLSGEHDVRMLPRIIDESELIEQAHQADACVSMSFHGCVLASFAGIPVVPFTDGYYYDYKYADFSRYGDGRAIPQLRPSSMSCKTAATEAIDYIVGFNSAQAALRRRHAAKEMDSFYRQMSSSDLTTAASAG